MAERELESLLESSLKGLKEVIDVETVIGEKIVTADGTTIIPISKISFGFGLGGFESNKEQAGKNNSFSAGSGVGVTMQPMGFLIVSGGETKMLKVEDTTTVDKVLDIIPDAISSLSSIFHKK